ncbi:MAG: CBS domain-containing protein [Tepidisphaeraceae bacterium]
MPCAFDILRGKDSTVHSIEPDATVLAATHKMNQYKLGALVVMQSGKLVGMFTERDVLTRVVGEQRSPATTIVADVMTSQVIYATPQTEIEELASIMQQKRIRHVPICDESGKLHGMISIGDVNAYHVSHQEEQIHFLNDYIYGRA